MTKNKLLNLTGVARYLGIHKRTLYRMIENGEFNVKPIVKVRPRLWNSEHIDEWRKILEE